MTIILSNQFLTVSSSCGIFKTNSLDLPEKDKMSKIKVKHSQIANSLYQYSTLSSSFVVWGFFGNFLGSHFIYFSPSGAFRASDIGKKDFFKRTPKIEEPKIDKSECVYANIEWALNFATFLITRSFIYRKKKERIIYIFDSDLSYELFEAIKFILQFHYCLPFFFYLIVIQKIINNPSEIFSFYISFKKFCNNSLWYLFFLISTFWYFFCKRILLNGLKSR